MSCAKYKGLNSRFQRLSPKKKRIYDIINCHIGYKWKYFKYSELNKSLKLTSSVPFLVAIGKVILHKGLIFKKQHGLRSTHYFAGNSIEEH